MPSRTRFSLTLLFFALAIAAGYHFLLPEVEAIKSTRAMRILAEKKLQHEKELVALYQKITLDVEEHAEELERTRIALPTIQDPVTDVPELLTMMQAVEERSHVFLSSVKTGQRTTAVSAGKNVARRTPVVRPLERDRRTIEVDGVASYDAMKDFLHTISTSLRIIEPTSITFKATKQGEIVPFTLNAYVFTESACATSPRACLLYGEEDGVSGDL